MARRRRLVPLLLARVARRSQAIRDLYAQLRDLYDAILTAARRLVLLYDDLTRIRAAFDDLVAGARGPFLDAVRLGAPKEAQRAYNRTIQQIRELGLRAEFRDIEPDNRRALLDEVDKQILDHLDNLPERLYRMLEWLRDPNRSTSPRARRIARRLADDLGQTAQRIGEWFANRDQGTGWWDWVTVGDGRVRPAHRLQGASGPVKIGSRFPHTDCRFPRDPTGPYKQIVNCRCHTRPASPPWGLPDVA